MNVLAPIHHVTVRMVPFSERSCLGSIFGKEPPLSVPRVRDKAVSFRTQGSIRTGSVS